MIHDGDQASDDVRFRPRRRARRPHWLRRLANRGTDLAAEALPYVLVGILGLLFVLAFHLARTQERERPPKAGVAAKARPETAVASPGEEGLGTALNLEVPELVEAPGERQAFVPDEVHHVELIEIERDRDRIRVVNRFGDVIRFRPEDVVRVTTAVTGTFTVLLRNGHEIRMTAAQFRKIPTRWRYRMDYSLSGNVEPGRAGDETAPERATPLQQR